MAGGKDWLEGILKRRAYEETPLTILDVEKGTAPGKGENYLSQIQKMRAKVLLGSGRIKHVSFLIKSEHETEHMKKLSVESGAFLKEITMYRDVLPKMQELLEEVNDPDGIFWAKCYDLKLYNRLVFEDLGASGFRMANRMKLLSLNAALMAVKHFAKFHALSKILLDRGDLPMDVMRESCWMKTPQSSEITKNMIASNMMKMCKRMELWGEEWVEATERLRAADLGQCYVDLFNAQPDEFVVLCHGDTWTNNMLFQGEDLENPVSLRLIDFQLCFINTPARDLSQLFFSSVRLEDRKQNSDLLIQTYTEALQSYLLKLGCSSPSPSVEDIRNSFEKRAPMRLCDTISFVPMVMSDAEEAPDMEEIMKKHNEALSRGEKASLDFSTTQTTLKPEVEAIIKYEIKKAIELGII